MAGKSSAITAIIILSVVNFIFKEILMKRNDKIFRDHEINLLKIKKENKGFV